MTTRVTVTAGGRQPADRGGALRRLDDMTGPPTGEDEARQLAAPVRCPACQGQATATRGVVWINHAPRCPRRRGGTRQEAL